MIKTKQRILSLLLAFALMLSFAPIMEMPAFAAVPVGGGNGQEMAGNASVATQGVTLRNFSNSYFFNGFLCDGSVYDESTHQFEVIRAAGVPITLTLGDKTFTSKTNEAGYYSFDLGTDVNSENAYHLYIPRGVYGGVLYEETSHDVWFDPDTVPIYFKIYRVDLDYKVTEDDFSFSNSHNSFGYGSNYRIPVERYAQLYGSAGAQYLYDNLGVWGGSCFGFSVSNLALYDGNLEKSNYQSGADYIYSIDAPRSPSNPLTQLLELFQVSQFAKVISDQIHENNKNRGQKLVDEVRKFQQGDRSAGVVLAVMSPTRGGHAIVPYAVQNIGGTKYVFSVYDNNYPDDTNRQMTLDTSNNQWHYNLGGNMVFGSIYGPGDYFGFVSYKEVFDLVNWATGIGARSGASSSLSVSGDGMSAFIPNGSTLKDESGTTQSANVLMGLINGQPSQRTNQMFTLDSGTYSVTAGVPARGARSAGGTGNTASFLSNGSTVSVQTDDPNSTIYGGAGGNVSIDSAGQNNFTITYNGSNTSNNPVTLSGSASGILSATVSGNNLQVTSSNGATFTSTQGGSYTLAAGQTTSIALNPVVQRTSSNRSSGSSNKQSDPVKSEPQMKWLEKSGAQTLAKETQSGSVVTTKYAGPYGARKSALNAFAGLRYRHDTLTGGAIEVRITLPTPELAKQDLLLTGRVKGGDADKFKAYFEKWFKNKVRVIHFDQQGVWGQSVEIAAKIDLSGMDTANLYFYSYDKSVKTYKRIGKPNYRIDKNGYLHFTTEHAGDIIISEGLLERK